MTESFSRSAALKSIVTLAWPTVLEQVLTTAVSYVDSAMVGKVGAHASAAVGATMTANWLISSSVSAFGIGFLSYISHELGAGRAHNAKRAVAQVSSFILLIGIFVTVTVLSLSRNIASWMHVGPDIIDDASRYFFILYIPALPYVASILYATCLRASGDTRTPLRVNLLVNLINILGNFFLIYPTRTVTVFSASFTVFGAGLGVTGAAVASAASFFIGGIGMTAMILRHPLLSPRGCSLKPDRSILAPCMRISIPCALQRFVTSFGYVAFATLINSLGVISTAAHSIANTAESAFYIPGYGMQTAAATLSANCWGARDNDRMKRLCRILIALEVALMFMSGALLFLFAVPVMGFFTPDAEVISLGARVLRMVALSEPIYGIAVILEGIFQGVGDTRATFCFNIIGMWGVRILGSFITIRFFGGDLTTAWGCMIGHNVLLGALLLARYFSGRWNPLREGGT